MISAELGKDAGFGAGSIRCGRSVDLFGAIGDRAHKLVKFGVDGSTSFVFAFDFVVDGSGLHE